ncbi:MAG TPA: hypothetical protein VN917_06480 [Xanthobacteraceae bacterium]|nr:hypothetical protein [Xanthobacteraceae bacterium]
MARLYFRCPVTGQEIDVGIESELGTLLRIRRSAVHAVVRCVARGTIGASATLGSPKRHA